LAQGKQKLRIVSPTKQRGIAIRWLELKPKAN